ncbi:MAG TPA: hypothetical protein VFG63_08495 [Nocardioidaceae bacterium]|nr:hypothetical protein [Nocardioidaceae bacterium]
MSRHRMRHLASGALGAVLVAGSCLGCGLGPQESPDPLPARQLPSPVDGVSPTPGSGR